MQCLAFCVRAQLSFCGMNGIALIFSSLQALLVFGAMLMGIWVKLPWPGLAGIGLLSVAIVAAQVMPVWRRERIGRWSLIAGWIGALDIIGSVWFAKDAPFLLDSYYAMLAWLVATLIFLAAGRMRNGPSRAGWKMLGMVWAFLGALIWSAVGYCQNRPGAFYFGLVIWLALLVACRSTFRMSAPGILAANTLMLLLIGLPIADSITRPSYHLTTDLDLAKRYYSYEAARKDPVAFGRWWKFYVGQWMRLSSEIALDDPTMTFPIILRSNCQGSFFQSRISINNRGFRGREVSAEKGNAYRIVALGESTTFGFTMHRDDKPWPEMLEEMIRDRLKPSRPVEVINAGVPRYQLKHNLLRLPVQILPLKPDMIISYHGANGFEMVHSVLPLRKVELPPAYCIRPLKLLADFEYDLKMIWYRHRRSAKPIPPLSLSEAMQTQYAQGYRELIQMTQTNGIRLVLANYSMAVNGRSDRGVIEFYRGGFPMVDWWIKANVIHSMIVKQLADEHAEICWVDTNPNLDGEHDKFVDIMHFTHEGEQQMAETMFNGIKSVLAEDLSHSHPVNSN